MREIIKDKAIVADDWNLLKLAEGELPDSVIVASGKQIVPLKVWLAQKETLRTRSDIGVWIASDERPEELKDDVAALPVIAVDSLDEAIAFVNADAKPLALYTFSEDGHENDRVLAGATSGGACVNGTIMHLSNPYLPFGGVGASGMGAYHGRFGFDTFSHRRSVHTRSTKLDPSMIYPPYTAGKQKLVRRGIGLSDPRDIVAKLRNSVRRRKD